MGSGDPPGPPLLPPSGGGGGDMEARVRVLETHVEYIRSGIAKLEGFAESSKKDLAELNVKMATLSANVAHLPSKGFIATYVSGAVSLAVGALALLSRFGFLTPLPGH